MNLITIPNPNPSAKVQLFCFPFAGGGARTFLHWYKHLPSIELCLIAYPGREHRFKEKAITDIDLLLGLLMEECKKVIRTDFAIFGHSMGSIISYGLATKLEESQIIPKHLFVSSAAAPTRTLKQETMLSLLPEDQFIQTLVERYNAIPDIILQDSGLMQIFATILRNDISLEEQYIKKYGAKINNTHLSCNITAFGGVDDIAVKEKDLMTWKNLTQGKFNIKVLPGTHFYLNEHPDLLFQEIEKKLDYYSSA
jgi:medium-chain acyl-[acyl-carrier-protein] hydrolase